MICLNIQGASSIEHTIYGHVLGHKGGARAPSAPWLDPPLCLFVLEFYGPVNNEVISSRSVNSSTVPGQA